MQQQEKADSFRLALIEQLAIENETKVRKIINHLFEEAQKKERWAIELILEYFLCKAPKLIEHNVLELKVKGFK